MLILISGIAIVLVLFVVVYATHGYFWHSSTVPPPAALEQKQTQKKRTKVLMFGWEFPPFNSGGLGVACLGLAKALSEHADITLVLPKKMPVTFDHARLVFADLPDVSGRGVNSSLTPYLTSGSYAALPGGAPLYANDLVDEVYRYGAYGTKFAEEEPHDIIYAHDWLSFPAAIAAKKVSGKPFIAHMHATEFDRTGESGMDQRIYDIERRGLHAADHVVAVSERTKQMIMRHYGIPGDKIEVVHNGIDETTAPAGAAIAPRLKALKDAGYQIVLFMGRLTLQKGPDYFLNAAKRVLLERPRTMFIVAGAGDMQQQVIRQAAALGIGSSVLFPGFLRNQDQHDAYAEADLFVMPSVSEPFGITALEAMRAGTPVIVSKQSGVAEVATTALKVDFWDVEKMARSMLDVLSDQTLSEHLKRVGALEAATLTWKRAGDHVHELMESLVPHPLPA